MIRLMKVMKRGGDKKLSHGSGDGLFYSHSIKYPEQQRIVNIHLPDEERWSAWRVELDKEAARALRRYLNRLYDEGVIAD